MLFNTYAPQRKQIRNWNKNFSDSSTTSKTPTNFDIFINPKCVPHFPTSHTTFKRKQIKKINKNKLKNNTFRACLRRRTKWWDRITFSYHLFGALPDGIRHGIIYPDLAFYLRRNRITQYHLDVCKYMAFSFLMQN